VRACLSASKAVVAADVHWKASHLRRAVNGAVVVDEPAIVAGEPAEAAKRLNGMGQGSRLHCADLVSVHGHDAVGDDMTQVLDPLLPERVLGALKHESVLSQCEEDSTDVL